MPDYDFNKKVPISGTDFTKAVADAMKTEPFASTINETYGIEKVFFAFGARVGSILFEERIMVEK
ncbi:MAG TPA: hypothetical protein DC035_02030 [Lachnospiraceae bacterium]|nr:hypothetical protein [Lachnospiraceae bacterium]